mmetsp:Transcript_84190/g.234785  ORF Transcript_84190/g.234785 Transcript_84190/m.234785 type:complete len:255 (+) Transcript_84190:1018-1782(+)
MSPCRQFGAHRVQFQHVRAAAHLPQPRREGTLQDNPARAPIGDIEQNRGNPPAQRRELCGHPVGHARRAPFDEPGRPSPPGTPHRGSHACRRRLLHREARATLGVGAEHPSLVGSRLLEPQVLSPLGDQGAKGQPRFFQKHDTARRDGELFHGRRLLIGTHRPCLGSRDLSFCLFPGRRNAALGLTPGRRDVSLGLGPHRRNAPACLNPGRCDLSLGLDSQRSGCSSGRRFAHLGFAMGARCSGFNAPSSGHLA